jgi:carotenoid cleavage dioxygenase-like enzyme
MNIAVCAYRKGGRLGNALRFPANAANTSVQMLAKKLLALWEGGPPYEVYSVYSAVSSIVHMLICLLLLS